MTYTALQEQLAQGSLAALKPLIDEGRWDQALQVAEELIDRLVVLGEPEAA